MRQCALLTLLCGAISAAIAAQSCNSLADTDFNGYDVQPLQRRSASSSDECCEMCSNNTAAGCKVWTYMPNGVCYLKTSAAGQRSMPGYVSGYIGSGPTLPRGGGTCSTSFDCSLGGECIHGQCACDPQYTGAQCGVLRLRRAKLNNGMAHSIAEHTWGGHAMQDKASGKWVGFFSYMANGCDLSTWGSNSMIVRAVADAPDGPFDQQVEPVTGPWTHNAMISKHPNGSYLLFHIGDGTHTDLRNCSDHPLPFYPFHPEPAPATTHISESLFGPFRPAPGIPAINNPAPFYFENGTTLIYGREDVHWASSTDGPYVNHKSTVVTDGTMQPEE